MDFGTFHLFERPENRTDQEMINEQLYLMEAAEDLGFSSVWAAEHHFGDYGICPNAVMALTAVARRTKTIRLGTGIVVLPLHNPLRAAEELAFLDNVSGGRLDVGLGRGYRAKELGAYDVDMAQTRAIFKEGIELMLEAWTKDRATYHGQYFNIDNLEVRPRPVQQPHPRTWVGSLSPETFELVGKMGANLLFTPRFAPDENIPEQVKQYKASLIARGEDPASKRIGALRFVYVADTMEQARDEFRGPWTWFNGEAGRQNAPEPGSVQATDPRYQRNRTVSFDEREQAGSLLVGDPDHVIRKLEEMQKTWNLTNLILWTRVGGLSTEKILHSMELTSKYIIPHFKEPAVRA